jgi:hypothetical protein
MSHHKFKTFLKSLKTTDNTALVEAIFTGYQAIYEDIGPDEIENFDILYHGTDEDSAEHIRKYGLDMSKSSGGYFGYGFYTTPDANLAKDNYADFSGEDAESGVVLKFKLNPDANILDLRKPEHFEIWKKYDNAYSRPDFYKTITRDGYDGLFDRSFDGVVIYNPKALKLIPTPEA